MTSATPYSFVLKPSRTRRAVVVAGHLLAAAGWLIAAPGPWVAVAGSLLLVGCARRSLAAAQPSGLATDGEGVWTVRYSGREPVSGRLCRARIAPGLLSLTLEGSRRNAVALFDDAFCDADHRMTLLLLRHGNSICT